MRIKYAVDDRRRLSVTCEIEHRWKRRSLSACRNLSIQTYWRRRLVIYITILHIKFWTKYQFISIFRYYVHYIDYNKRLDSWVTADCLDFSQITFPKKDARSTNLSMIGNIAHQSSSSSTLKQDVGTAPCSRSSSPDSEKQSSHGLGGRSLSLARGSLGYLSIYVMFSDVPGPHFWLEPLY